MEKLVSALTAVKLLRASVGNVFEILGNGIKAEHGEEHRDSKFLFELQEILHTVNLNLRDLESIINGLTPPTAPFNLGHSSLLSQETSLERQAMYTQLVNSYKWMHKIHEYSMQAGSILSSNALKRSYFTHTNKRRRPLTSSHNIPPAQVDFSLGAIKACFRDMNMQIYKPYATNVIVHVIVGNILRAAFAFKGIMIEWVSIKGFDESFEEVDDLWTESRHAVYRKVQNHAHSAMLHFYSPTLPELAVRSFLTWLNSYAKLFTDPCKKCGNHMLDSFPPTWRDLRTLEPFHEECK